jgi:FkbM family methyltransferase
MAFKSWAINAVQGFLHKRNFVIHRLPLPDLNSLDIVSLLAARVAVPPEQFCVLQIGANDGQYVDPIYPLLKKNPWRAVRVEPLPEPFAKLKALHEGDQRVMPVNCAVAETDGEATIYRFENHPDVPLSLTVCASFDRRLLLRQVKHRPSLRKHVVGVKVPAYTVATLMGRCSLPRIDLLQVDAEGYDYRLIRTAFAAGVLPAIINFESWHLPVDEKRQCAQELADRGYNFATVGRDTVAAHQSILPA